MCDEVLASESPTHPKILDFKDSAACFKSMICASVESSSNEEGAEEKRRIIRKKRKDSGSKKGLANRILCRFRKLEDTSLEEQDDVTESAKTEEELAEEQSLIETAKANNLNAFQYLYTLLLYMPDHLNSPESIDQLLPWSDFIQTHCTGQTDVETMRPEEKPELPT